MINVKRYILACTCVLLGAGLSAQTFNETVEVTNDLLVDMSGSERKTVEMEIPDSLSEFRLNFDYSVFSKPYKGAYEFTPYNVLFRPISGQERRPLLYLDAGAGFAFNPTLSAVLTPRISDKFMMSVYQDFDGYVGQFNGNGGHYDGYELAERIGAQAWAWFKPVELSLNTFYRGMWTKDFALSGSPFHTFAIQADLTSKGHEVRSLHYGLTVDYRFSGDYDMPVALRENALEVRGYLTPVMLGTFKHRFTLFYDMGVDSYRGADENGVKYLKVNPKMTFLWKFLTLNAGLKATGYRFDDRTSSLRLYPDLSVSIPLLKDRMEVVLGVTGGDKSNSYFTYKSENPHFTMDYFDDMRNTFKASKEFVNVFVGLSGSIGTRFQYKMTGGYSDMGNAPLYALAAPASNQVNVVLSRYYSSYLKGEWIWQSRSWDINSYAKYQKVSVEGDADVFTPADWNVYIDVTYNKLRRIFGGVSLEYMGSRDSRTMGSRPAYWDLGIHADYKIDSRMMVWLRGGNLLNQTVELVPFTSHRLPYLTAGLRFNIY